MKCFRCRTEDVIAYYPVGNIAYMLCVICSDYVKLRDIDESNIQNKK